MGSQWTGMGKHLMQLPIFAESIHRCAAILKKKNVDLLRIITDDDPTIFDNILHSFVGIAAIQVNNRFWFEFEMIKNCGFRLG